MPNTAAFMNPVPTTDIGMGSDEDAWANYCGPFQDYAFFNGSRYMNSYFVFNVELKSVEILDHHPNDRFALAGQLPRRKAFPAGKGGIFYRRDKLRQVHDLQGLENL
ncbi:hypothetical protein [Herbaspirillum seropedicae]|uniref:hypothetical protein n=1 Tax=Herbaspirillum seropedicae TaxID=964 RepID=UPI003D95FECF